MKSDAGAHCIGSAIARRIRSDNEMLAGSFVALSSVHSFNAKKGD